MFFCEMNWSLTLQHYQQLVFVKVAANLRAEASKSYLSYLWWVFEPLLHMLVFYLVFGLLLRRGTDNFVAYLLSGLIPWLWFSKSIGNSMSSIIQGKGLMMQVYLPKLIFPVIVICQDLVKQSIVMLLLLTFLLIYGIPGTLTWMALPFLMLVEFCLISACAFVVAAVIPFLPDLRYLVNTGLMMLMFCSGVFYSMDAIPEKYHDLFLLNPIALLLSNYRRILLYNQWPDWVPLLVLLVLSLLFLALFCNIMRRFDHIYPRVVL